ncbi:MAG: SufE family protein [Pseudomonadota bacterium]
MSGETFEDLVETFEFMDDWEDRYRYVIDLGKQLPPMDDGLKNPVTKVDGCASQVWLVPSIEGDGGERRLTFDGDSDAMIVRGLIAILRILLSGRRPEEIAAADPMAAFAQLGLDQHLSAQRSNGLRAMIERLRALAAAAAA